jgi:hypothetical protein
VRVPALTPGRHPPARPPAHPRSPSAVHQSESLSTLRYAERAKLIRTRAVVVEDPAAALIRQLREEIRALRAQLLAGGVASAAALGAVGAGAPAGSTLVAADGAVLPGDAPANDAGAGGAGSSTGGDERERAAETKIQLAVLRTYRRGVVVASGAGLCVWQPPERMRTPSVA